MKKQALLFLVITHLVLGCATKKTASAPQVKNPSGKPFIWEAATVYFLLTDRFNNGQKSNDINFDRTKKTAVLRGFHGGDLRGVIQKLDEGYFDELGINALWLTPIVEQIQDGVDEGTGFSYGFHGYWTRDWTALDPNWGTEQDLAELIEKAHSRGIRVMLDAVINHTGPVTAIDPVWPDAWVRTSPQCDYQTYESTVTCTLVKNLPDIRTESEQDVPLPRFLAEKWKREGRYESEMKSLDDFFRRTGYPRAPKYYIIKWLTDYVAKYGIDGYRADTVKHTEENVWGAFKTQCEYSFKEWKKKNPSKVLDNNSFYTVAEVYNYGVSAGQDFNFGNKKVNYFQHGFNGMINFEFKWHAQQGYEQLFSRYSNWLNNELEGLGIMNYLSSHDDGSPFDPRREKPFETATKLLLSPGIAQIYYGDETARILVVDGATGDANLRSPMNWADIQQKASTREILEHWQKLGQFRKSHPAIGAGHHMMISQQPYVFSRALLRGSFLDKVVVGLDLPPGSKELNVSAVFADGTVLRDAYSDQLTTVTGGRATLSSPFSLVLLEKSE
jgi:alpha-amylase